MKVTTAFVALVGGSLALFFAMPATSTAAAATTSIATRAASLVGPVSVAGAPLR
jgi:hypothetical protein